MKATMNFYGLDVRCACAAKHIVYICQATLQRTPLGLPRYKCPGCKTVYELEARLRAVPKRPRAAKKRGGK